YATRLSTRPVEEAGRSNLRSGRIDRERKRHLEVTDRGGDNRRAGYRACLRCDGRPSSIVRRSNAPILQNYWNAGGGGPDLYVRCRTLGARLLNDQGLGESGVGDCGLRIARKLTKPRHLQVDLGIEDGLRSSLRAREHDLDRSWRISESYLSRDVPVRVGSG